MFTILYCSQVCFTRQFGVNFCTNEHSVLCLSASVLSAVNAQNYAMHVHIFTFRLFSSLICHSVSHWRTVNARRQIKRQAIARTQRLFQCVCVFVVSFFTVHFLTPLISSKLCRKLFSFSSTFLYETKQNNTDNHNTFLRVQEAQRIHRCKVWSRALSLVVSADNGMKKRYTTTHAA